MNLASNIIATAKTDVIVRIRGAIIQIATKRACIRPIVPIATT